MKSVSLLGVPITISSCEEILFEVKRAVEEGESRCIVTPNPEIIVEAQRNKQFLKVLQNADIALPDGTGVVLALQLKNICVQRLPGRVFFLHLLDLADRYAWNIYLLGASEESNTKAIEKVRTLYPRIHVKGSSRLNVEDDIKKFSPHLLFVALGHPKQEFWADRMRKNLPHTVIMTVGGTLDYFSGTVPLPPTIVSSFCLEWLFRLLSQPSRWKRIFTAVVVFPWYIVKGLAFLRNYS